MGLFIGENQLKANSVLNENVDMKLITPIIQLVHDKYVLQTLGTALYNRVSTAIDNDATLATQPDVKTLIDVYLSNMIIWWTLYEMNPVLNYKMTNKSILQMNADASNYTSKSDLTWLMDRQKDNAQFYTNMVVKYLQAHPGIFPEYNQPGYAIDTVIPKKRPYAKGIFLGRTYKDIELPVYRWKNPFYKNDLDY